MGFDFRGTRTATIIVAFRTPKVCCMFAVFSTSLSSSSRSRILARYACAQLEAAGETAELFDLAEQPLPFCDAGNCYQDPNAVAASDLIRQSTAILIAAPIYNFDFGSAAKNLIELTGKAWTEKVVGLLCAAGGQGSYMAPMQLANSLMLDFRSLVLPRFVYATGEHFQNDEISDSEVAQRTDELVKQLIKVGNALRNES